MTRPYTPTMRRIADMLADLNISLTPTGLRAAEAALSRLGLAIVPTRGPEFEAEIARLQVAERERIARMLEFEAETLPCAEDAAVTRGNAMLVRGDGSYDETEEIEARISAAEREIAERDAEIARLRDALTAAADTMEAIRLTLIAHLAEPERTAFWAAVQGRDAARSALTPETKA